MTPDDVRLVAEQRARVLIDRQLVEAGWVVQDKGQLNLFVGPGSRCARGRWRRDTAGPTTSCTRTPVM